MSRLFISQKNIALLFFVSAWFITQNALADLSIKKRSAAVSETAQTAKVCRDLGDFYWEIGDANQPQAQGSIGRKYQRDTVMKIASASKWVFGSYVLEKIAPKELTTNQLQLLEMQSGYTSLKYPRCVFSRTVQGCFDGRNSRYDEAQVGKFFYNGGHAQKLAIELGLGDMNSKEFDKEIMGYLNKKNNGDPIAMDFASPQPAGGMEASADEYGKFLRKILSGQLRMKNYLDYHPVCTLPAACSNATESPVPVAWHYSIHHWIEDDANGDGAFSSPGAFGFYPWISSDQQWYGILAREHHGLQAYKESVYCGEKLRQAWFSGVTQP